MFLYYSLESWMHAKRWSWQRNGFSNIHSLLLYAWKSNNKRVAAKGCLPFTCKYCSIVKHTTHKQKARPKSLADGRNLPSTQRESNFTTEFYPQYSHFYFHFCSQSRLESWDSIYPAIKSPRFSGFLTRISID